MARTRDARDSATALHRPHAAKVVSGGTNPPRAEETVPTITLEITEQDARELAEAAARRALTPEALAGRSVQERLIHERERAAGGDKAMSPRARRAEAAADQPAADR